MEALIDEKLKTRYESLVEKEHLLPIKVTDFYKTKVREEIDAIGYGGPLYRSVIPTLEKLDLHTSIETRDYVEEYKHMPIPDADYIIQKYEDRVLVIITELCLSHCQYCFRTYNLSEFKKDDLKVSLSKKVHVLKEYLRSNSKIHEVILSGGDPLSIGYENMQFILSELKEWNVRIHTRAIVYEPAVFSQEMIKLLSSFNVRLVFHINHPYEICQVVKEKIHIMHMCDIKMYAQFPLLRGINDHSDVLIELLMMMDNLYIRPISIFIPDPIMYGADYRVSFSRIISIMDELNWKTPSWINSVRFVMDTTFGKVRRENILKIEGKNITFYRDGHQIEYYDLDDGIDMPGDINKMLWKSRKGISVR